MELQPQQLVWTEWAMIAIFLAGVVGWGLIMSFRKDESVEESFMAGRELPGWMAAMSTVATLFNVNDFIGKFGFIYVSGIVILHIDPINGIMITLAAIVVVNNLRRVAPVSLGHWLDQRFSSAVGLSYSLVWTMVWMVFNMGLYIYAGSLILETLLGLDRDVSIIGLSLLAAFYTLIGGFRAVVATDILQLMLLFFPFIVLAIMILVDTGGFGELLKNFNSEDSQSNLFPSQTPHGPIGIMILGGMFQALSYWSTEAQILQRPLSSRSPDDASVAYLGSVVWIIFLKPFLVIIPVLAALPLIPQLSNPDQIGPYLIIDYLPSGMYGMIIIGLMAGFLSSADSQINAFCTMFTTDIVQRRLIKDRTPKYYLNLSRALGLVFTVAAIGMAYWIGSNKAGMMAFAFSVLVTIMPPFGAITILSIVVPRVNTKGATAGLLVGCSVALFMFIPAIGGSAELYQSIQANPEAHGLWHSYLCLFEAYKADTGATTTMYLRSLINFSVTALVCLGVSFATKSEKEKHAAMGTMLRLSPAIKKQAIGTAAGCLVLWFIWIILFG